MSKRINWKDSYDVVCPFYKEVFSETVYLNCNEIECEHCKRDFPVAFFVEDNMVGLKVDLEDISFFKHEIRYIESEIKRFKKEIKIVPENFNLQERLEFWEHEKKLYNSLLKQPN